MADLEPTAALIGLLADVHDRSVLTNQYDGVAYLDVPGEPDADVSQLVWTAEQAGWIREPIDSLVWELTDLGRTVLERGAP